jgi:hypothetical protein
MNINVNVDELLMPKDNSNLFNYTYEQYCVCVGVCMDLFATVEYLM